MPSTVCCGGRFRGIASPSGGQEGRGHRFESCRVRAKGLIVGVIYSYSSHPLLHQMAAMVRKGMLGDIRIVDLKYTAASIRATTKARRTR